MKPIAGRVSLKIDGTITLAKGDFTYNLGRDKKETVMGIDGPHGVKLTPQVGKINGKITDHGTLDIAKLCDTTSATITLELANGKTIVGREMHYAADGDVSTGESEIDFNFEGTVSEA